MEQQITIRTSEQQWMQALAIAYKNKQDINLIDDAKTGINPSDQSLIQMARHAKISKRETIGVCVACGISGVGVWMLALAYFDPEPTSKLGLLIAGGTVCVIGGGFRAIQILTNLRPPKIVISKKSIEISW